jgi:hypothetical protein
MHRTVLRLAGILVTLSGTVHAAPYCAQGEAPRALARRVEQALGPAPVTQLGPSADTLVRELTVRICADTRMTSELPNTCSPGGTVSDLRARLISDLVAVPAAALANRLASLPEEQRLGIALMGATAGGVEPPEVAHRVAHLLGYAGEDCVPPVTSANDSLGVAVAVVWALANDAAHAASEAQASERIAEALVAARGRGPNATEQPFIERLARQQVQVLAARNAWRARPTDAGALKQLLLAQFVAFEDALALTHGAQMKLPPEAWATVSAIVDADVDSAVDQLRSWLAARAQLESSVLDTAALLLRFARATSQEQAERIVRGRVLGLGPWSDKVLFSASGGIPQLQSNDFNVVGEGMLGYNDESWGLSADGGASVVEFDSAQYLASTVKLHGGGEGWFSLAVSDRTRIDVRAAFEMVVFDSDSTINQQGAVLNGSETSAIIRGAGLLGVRHQAPGFAAGVWAGGGGQVDSHDQRATVVDANTTTQLKEVEAASMVLEGRSRLQWGFVPDTLALRFSADAKYYKLARMSAVIDTAAPDEILVQTDEAAIQLELIGRLYVDVEAARLFGFVPAAGVGVDHYQLAVTGQPTQVTTIPIYFLGVRRTTF